MNMDRLTAALDAAANEKLQSLQMLAHNHEEESDTDSVGDETSNGCTIEDHTDSVSGGFQPDTNWCGVIDKL